MLAVAGGTSIGASYSNLAAPANGLIVQGNVGIGTSTANGSLQFANTFTNRKIVVYATANNDHEYYGIGANTGVMRYQINSTANNHIFYAGSSTTTSVELMRITGTGRVGINNINPSYTLHVSGDIYATSDITAFSDKRFKTNVESIPDALQKVIAVNGYTFNVKDWSNCSRAS
jgi:hypothetical protein